MKRIAFAVLMAFSSATFATPEFGGGDSSAKASASAAQGQAQGQLQGQAQGQLQGQGQGQSASQSVSQGNNQSMSSTDSATVNVNVSNATNYQRQPVATAFAAGLASSFDTCMGSSSMGVQSIGFGISLGSTWTDENCKRLKNSARLQLMGFSGAALALMCQEKTVAQAMRVAGTPCKE